MLPAAVTSNQAGLPPCGDGEEGFESDKEDAPLDASVLERMPVHLVPLADIRPTQLAVGMQQVSEEQGNSSSCPSAGEQGTLFLQEWHAHGPPHCTHSWWVGG